MSVFVLDASVAAKWFLPAKGETLTAEALALLGRYAKGETQLIVPDLFWSEFANIMWKASRQGRLSARSAGSAITEMIDRDLPTTPSSKLLPEAFSIAMAFNRSVYDSLYVALAVISNAQMITADERLANSLAAYSPVKWLGAF